MFDDHPCIIARAGHPLTARSHGIVPDDLIRYPWIVPSRGTPLRTQWATMFEAVGLKPPHVPIECGSVLMVRQILIESDFLTLLSTDQVQVELEAGCLAVVGDAPGDISRTIGVTTRADWRPTRLQSVFADLLIEQALSAAHGRRGD